MNRTISILAAIAMLVTFSFPLAAGGQGEADQKPELKPVKLIGATDLPQDYSNYRALVYFGEKLKEYYDGPVEIEVHHSGDLGNQKDFFEFMMQGISVDFALVAPAHMATWDKRASIMDPPFLWRNLDHWEKGLSSDVFKPIADELQQKGVRIIGYGGGGTRNLILKKPVYTMADLPSVLMRVMGSPIQANAFAAVGIRPTPMNYLEVYNAIKTGTIDGLENEAGSLLSMKFYEVAPYVILTRHAITVRPLCFSEKRFQSFSPELQEAILKAGQDAAKWHRDTESREDAEALKKMQDEGKITLVEFDNAEMVRLNQQVLADYAQELGAESILEQIIAID